MWRVEEDGIFWQRHNNVIWVALKNNSMSYSYMHATRGMADESTMSSICYYFNSHIFILHTSSPLPAVGNQNYKKVLHLRPPNEKKKEKVAVKVLFPNL